VKHAVVTPRLTTSHAIGVLPSKSKRATKLTIIYQSKIQAKQLLSYILNTAPEQQLKTDVDISDGDTVQ